MTESSCAARAAVQLHSRNELAPGELVCCAIVSADGYDLVAQPVDGLEKRVGLKVLC